jgi:hypothetical protein
MTWKRNPVDFRFPKLFFVWDVMSYDHDSNGRQAGTMNVKQHSANMH